MNSDEAAINILKIFVEKFDKEPGQVLLMNSINAHWTNYSDNFNDLNGGILYAFQNNWIDLKEQNIFKITDKGYSLIKKDKPTQENYQN